MRTYRQLLVSQVFFLAILVQVMLPAAMVRAAAALALTDGATICSTSSNDGLSEVDGAPGQHQHNLCLACQVSATPHAILVTEPSAAQTIVVVTERIVFDPSQSAGPRGPPRIGTPARAPPSLS
jgi:hypothetical protein